MLPDHRGGLCLPQEGLGGSFSLSPTASALCPPKSCQGQHPLQPHPAPPSPAPLSMTASPTPSRSGGPLASCCAGGWGSLHSPSYYLKCHRPDSVIIGGFIYILPACNFGEAPCPPHPRGSPAVCPNPQLGKGREQELGRAPGPQLLQGRGVLAGYPDLVPVLAQGPGWGWRG